MTPSEMYLPAQLRTSAPHLLKTELRQLRNQLEAERAGQASYLAEPDVEAAGTGAGDLPPDRQLSDALSSHAREVLEDADAALARIENGTYGVCEECGGPIPFERLEAVPTTHTCIACTGLGRGFLS